MRFRKISTFQMTPFSTIITTNTITILRDPSSTIWTKIRHTLGVGRRGRGGEGRSVTSHQVTYRQKLRNFDLSDERG